MSADSVKQKQGSSGGSSQSSQQDYKINSQTYVRIWLTNTRIKIDNNAPAANALNSFDLPFSTEYDPVNLSTAHNNSSGNRIGISFGPEFVQKGGRSGSGGTKIVTTFNYIELPILLSYGHGNVAGGNWTFGTGPYFAYGVGGNTKFIYNGQTTKTKVFSAGGYKRFDAGITAGAYYLFPAGVSLGLSYDLGLANILSTTGVTTKNRCLSFEVGYSINKLLHRRKKEK